MSRKIRYTIRLKPDDDDSYGDPSLVTPCFQEKLLKILYRYPYRKPTQVVEERILR